MEGVALLENLEAWAEKQSKSLDMGTSGNLDCLAASFDSLLKVMDALFQVRGVCAVWGAGCRCWHVERAHAHSSRLCSARCCMYGRCALLFVRVGGWLLCSPTGKDLQAFSGPAA